MVVHRVKRIGFLGRTCPVLCQNENGPCPLLAICNGLLLRGSIALPAGRMEVSTQELVQLVANFLFEANSTAANSGDPNAARALDDVMGILPGLQVGLDVNVRFGAVDGFEFTPQLATFDLTGMRLVHGWTYDPQNRRAAAAVGQTTYNQLIETVINLRSALAEGASGGPAGIEGRGEVVENVDVHVGSVVVRPLSAPAEAAEAGVASTQATQATPAAQATQATPAAPAAQAAVAATGNSDGSVATVLSVSSAGGTVASHVMMDEGKCGNTSPVAVIQARSRTASETNAESHGTLAALEDFLDSTRTQLSYHGLAELHSFVRENELCVFFRNNHFSTMFKHQGSLYLLLTDVGYEHRPGYVWERLTEIDGDTMCCNSAFSQSGSGASAMGHVEANVVTGTIVGTGAGGTGGGSGGGGGRKAPDAGIVLSGTVVTAHPAAAASDPYAAAPQMTREHTELSHFMTPQELEHQRAELARLKLQQQQRQHQPGAAGTKKAKKKGSCTIS
jgi:hypothetical protein